ncbi:MAG: efflux RND transporter periplasmic adaptor subunit [Deltaproteobacteria bacterium HGW-Deltaproteobacteria-7]|jgi:HlyD family secretion protein|nr:MAG: efflux RND transporter periplasmic adaptor subunit [Deltaproteobacteria bacterium HGW-Deltaproteobacteria-7]PKN20732.1 MAG: efflux RND transporter periplasmic adaptor subunit [Deltaproteobacteria bacterium HGW-Deltaproteobacteria-6]
MKKIVVAIAILIMIISGLFFFIKKSDNMPQYVTQTADRGDIRATVSATGTVNAVTTVLVGTQVSGTIKQLFVDYNSTVKKGQLLAQIDPSSFEAQVSQASANLSLSRANLEKSKIAVRDTITTFERNKILFAKNFISKSDLDTSETNYLSALAQVKASEAQVQQARAALNLANTNLRYTQILSPVNGTVISRSIDVGQTVAASFQTPTLFNIAQDLTKMQIETSVDEADIGSIRTNQPVTFTVDAYPDVTFRGNVSVIRNAPTTVSNVVTYTVIVQVDNQELKLKPGMTANVSIIINDKKGVLRVPNAALRVKISDRELTARTPKGAGVWILDNKKPKRVPLTIGIRDNRFTEVLSGNVTEGSAIIVEVKDNSKTANAQTVRPPGPRF